MAFMQPEVLDKDEWAEVETNNGTSWVPFSVLSAREAESAKRGDFEPLLKYTEGTQVYNDQSRVRKGYGVRLSAPGYMDATEWEVYGSKKEALKRARELAREAEGEDYATKKRHHATKKSSAAQLDREIATATGIGTWKKSDQPYMSEHLDAGHASARVKPTSTYSGADYEWTIWIGPPGRRVLHQSGEVRTKAGAKRIAEQRLSALR